MLSLIVRRILVALPTLFCIVVCSFFLVRLSPGSPFSGERRLAPEVEQALAQRYGLHEPLPQQLLAYLGNLARGDLGPSIKYPEHSVSSLIAQAWPHTACLALAALLWAMLLAVALALPMALWPTRFIGRLASLLSTALLGTPSFVLGPLLVLALAGPERSLPPAGWGELVHVILPALTLGSILAGGFARLLASGLLDALRQDYVALARVKGVSFWRILWRHALWAALGPLFAYAGPSCAGLLAGSVAVEQLFLVPGLGPYFVDAATNRDYFLILGIVLVDAVLLIAMNIAADVALFVSDPRLRAQAASGGVS